jgi:hypothetical protein
MNGAISGKKVINHKIGVFISPATLSEKFHSKSD